MEPTENDDVLVGTPEADSINGLGGDDSIRGRAGHDTIRGGDGDDSINGGFGNDRVFGGSGVDRYLYEIGPVAGADRVNLGDDLDVVQVEAEAESNVRLTFTSAEVGDGSVNDSGTLANQDGGLAVRFQVEDASGAPAGDLSRFDDEGVVFVGGEGVTFDVRDLVSGAARGQTFKVVALGTSAGDEAFAVDPTASYYFNGGQGNDTISGGRADDFVVGGAGDDVLSGGLGAEDRGRDTFLGGAGDDSIEGGVGRDVVIYNVTTDGADSVRLEGGQDEFIVNASSPTNVRLTFTSSEVGDREGLDSNTLANQDGGLAVRLQAETNGRLSGPVTRVGDESITFTAGAGVTFDVRDLPTGTQRGDQFTTVMLGSFDADEADFSETSSPVYANAGQGDDSLIGGDGRDFLVGGAGDDRLNGWFQNDQLLGGGGDDRLIGGRGGDTITGGAGRDAMTGGAGKDVFIFSATTDSSADGSARDVIGKFQSGWDKIDLTAFDLDDDSQIQFTTVSDSKTIVRVDSDDDGQFDDFSLLVRGETPVAGDFLI